MDNLERVLGMRNYGPIELPETAICRMLEQITVGMSKDDLIKFKFACFGIYVIGKSADVHSSKLVARGTVATEGPAYMAAITYLKLPICSEDMRRYIEIFIGSAIQLGYATQNEWEIRLSKKGEVVYNTVISKEVMYS